MKSIKTLRYSTREKHSFSEAYAQYLFRTNQTVNADSWINFMGAHNNRRKIAKPLRVIQGGLK